MGIRTNYTTVRYNPEYLPENVNLQEVIEGGNTTGGTIQFTNSETGLVSTGDIRANRFIGDGSLLTNLPISLQDVTDNGNVTTNDITANVFIGDGSQLTNLPPINLQEVTDNGSVTTHDITANRFIGDGSQLSGIPINSNTNLQQIADNGNVTTNNITANAFIGDGSRLTNLPINLQQVTDNGNVTTNDITANAFIGDGSQLSGIPINSNTNLQDMTDTGTFTTNDITANAFIGEGSQLTNLPINLQQVTDNGNVTTNDITANAFIGDSSQLTGLSINPNTNLQGITDNGSVTTNDIEINNWYILNSVNVPIRQSTEESGAQLGWSVAMAPDGETFVVGAPGYNNSIYNDNYGQVIGFYTWYGQWRHSYSTHYGKFAQDYFGYSVAESLYGSYTVVGSPYNNDNGTKSGMVRVHGFSQRGQDIAGEAAYDESGFSVAISHDGSRIAVGAPGNDGTSGSSRGHVRVYDYNTSTSLWTKVGQDIDGEAAGDRSGHSVAMTPDGSRVVIGAPYNGGTSGTYSGHVRVYDYDASTSLWTKVGQDVDGEAAFDYSGWSVAISSDGSRIAVGAIENDGTSGSTSDNRGHVRVYDYDTSTSLWTKVGQDIDGEAAGDTSGYSIAMSADGSRIAVGAPGNDGERGVTRVYNWKSSTSQWTKLGPDLEGVASGNRFGHSVSMTSDGIQLVVGAPYEVGSQGVGGRVHAYKFLNVPEYTNSAFSMSKFIGDGSLLTNLPISLQDVTDNGNVTTNDITANAFVGDGSQLTNLPPINLQEVTDNGNVTTNDITANAFIGDGSLLTNLPINLQQVTDNGSVTTRDITANAFIGDGSLLTNLPINLQQVTDNGNVTTNDITANAFIGDGSQLTNLPPMNLQEVTNNGSVTTNDITANAFIGDGSLLTNLPISLQDVTDNGSVTTNDITANKLIINGIGVYNLPSSTWLQFGQDIAGEAAYDKFGYSIAMSADGSRIAVGATENDGTSGSTSDNRGHVRVYDYDASISLWTKVGQDIDGEAAGDTSGYSIAMSADGSRIAVGAPDNDGTSSYTMNNRGHVRVYDYNTSTSLWTKVGQDIDGENPFDESGYSIAMSSDGSRIAVGAIKNDGTSIYASDNRGHVRVYDYNTSTSLWTKVGQDIDGEATGDNSGWSVDISSDGSRVVIGAPGNDGTSSYANDNRGHVRVYDYNTSTSLWTKVGQDIDGEATADNSGWSVAISHDGSRIAVGARGNDGTSGSSRGHVRVYDYNTSTSLWTKVGQDIDGEAAFDYSGWSVAISSDGSRIAVGAPYNDATSGFDSDNGHVRVYDYDTSTSLWTKVGQDIDGEAAGDTSGYSIAMSADGSCIVVGSKNASRPGTPYIGVVHTYTISVTNILNINSDVTVNGTLTQTSDARRKTNLKVIDNALDKIAQVSGYTYETINEPGVKSTGVIAQEVAEILPEVVRGTENTTYSVAYDNMIGLFIEAIKELKNQIEVLENR